MVGAVARIVNVAIVATACNPSNAPPAPQPGIEPERFGAVGHLCPESHPVGVRDGLAYPPGHPSAPEFAEGPQRCFRSISEANAAGYGTAAPSPGSILVDDIYLVPTDASLIEECRAAADEISLPVACPTKFPAGGGLCPSIDRTVARFEGGFSVPPGHDPESLTHLWVVSAPSSALEDASCSQVLDHGRATVRGFPAMWISCGEGAEWHGGHVILRWLEGRGIYAVSLHGTTLTNRRIVRAIARSVTLVDP
jgi:hypothetical protein